MTRVNIVPPQDLTNQHLMAEFREIRHVGPSLSRSLKSKNFNINKIPKKYTLNKGHVTFFYNKGLFLYRRFNELKCELIYRGFNINKNTVFEKQQFPIGFLNDWIPSKSEIEINLERINLRIKEKPNFYKRNIINAKKYNSKSSN